MDIKNNVIYADSLFRPKKYDINDLKLNIKTLLYEMNDVVRYLNENVTDNKIDEFDYALDAYDELTKIKKIISKCENEIVKYASGIKL